MGSYAYIIAGFGLMILGAIFISKAKRKAARCNAPAAGVITAVDKEQEMDDKGRNLKRFSYTPQYRYSVNGQEFTAKADFYSNNENEFAVGMPLNVLYNPANPQESVVPGKSKKSGAAFGAAVLLFGVVIMIIGAFAA